MFIAYPQRSAETNPRAQGGVHIGVLLTPAGVPPVPGTTVFFLIFLWAFMRSTDFSVDHGVFTGSSFCSSENKGPVET